METTTAPPPPPVADAPTARPRTIVERAAAVATRCLAGLVAGLTLVQAAVAGQHLVGDPGALALHRVLGTQVITLVALLAVLTSLVQVRVRWWRLPISLVGFLAIGMQIGMGFTDRLDVHLPLGIALFGAWLLLALASHRPRRGHPPTG